MKPSTQRALAATAVFLVVCVGLAINTGLGTPSSFGWDAIATICPVGAVEVFLSQWMVTPHGLICLAITVILVVVFGRAFCGWFCPTSLLRRTFGSKKIAEKDRSDLHDTCAQGCDSCTSNCKMARAQVKKMTSELVEKTSEEPQAKKGGKRRIRIRNSPLDVRHAVLVGTLASTAILGVPIFCVVCPIGLTFGTVIGLWRLIQFNEGSITLIVFPVIIAIELFAMRKWCHRLCPLSAAVSLISKANRTFRPTVDAEKCLRESGAADCHACFEACPEAIDLHDLMAGAPLNECMKCRECVGACPQHAIAFPAAPVKVKEGTQVRLEA